MSKYYPLINKNSEFDAVILCDGDYPSAEIPLHILRNANFICCCDGAGNKYIRRGKIPNAIVGDGDSMSKNFMLYDFLPLPRQMLSQFLYPVP